MNEVKNELTQDSQKKYLKRPGWATGLGVVAIVFGLLTILAGGKALFTDAGRVAAGNYVPFVLWFNFICGFIYIPAGVSLLKGKKCTQKLSALLAISTVLVFVLFGLFISFDGAFEIRTVGAMILRSSFWIGFAIMVRRSNFFSSDSCACSAGV